MNYIYTDGGCQVHHARRPGAWAVVHVKDGVSEIVSGAELETTNNRMELSAMVQALTIAGQQLKENAESKITIVTDSKYVKDGLTSWIRKWKINGWKTAKGTPVLNKSLWVQLDELYKKVQPGIIIDWTKGHADNEFNNLADKVCTGEMKSLLETA